MEKMLVAVAIYSDYESSWVEPLASSKDRDKLLEYIDKHKKNIKQYT